MTDTSESPAARAQPPPPCVSGVRRGRFVAETLEDAWRIATAVRRAGTAPRGLEPKVEPGVAILAGAEWASP